MDIVIAERSDMPIYEQIYVQLASQILDGDLQAESMLPSIRTVAREVGTSIITIKKAWEVLESEDLIYTRAGKGVFVSAHPADNRKAKRRSLAVERFQREAPFYRDLAITREELMSIVEQEY